MIMKGAAAPVGTPWMWTLAFGHHEDRTPIYGLRSDARGGDGGVRQELAAGVEVGPCRSGTRGDGRWSHKTQAKSLRIILSHS